MNQQIPLVVTAQTIPAAWEQSVVALWTGGKEIKTQYDVEDHPPALDATMVMTVLDPSAQPRIHRAFPESLEGLAQYVQDVIFGARDHLVGRGIWTYSYHKRLAEYPGFSWVDFPGGAAIEGLINQIDYLVDGLAECWYSRRVQAITWVTSWDMGAHEPPCLQRVWVRGSESEGKMYLDMNLHWRSRDALKAAFMNLYAFAGLQAHLAARLSERLGQPVGCGRIVDITDSYHIYGKDREDLEKFIRSLEKRTFEQRTWRDDK
jgi:thymidylate synthase